MTEPQRSPFDPSLDEMVAMGEDAIRFAARYIDERYEAPTSDGSGVEDLLAQLRTAPPREGAPFSSLLEVVGKAVPKGFDTTNPGFVAYIPGGGLYATALADLLACVVNRYTGIAAPAPALVQMEATVLRWMCDLFELPETSQGVLTPGGSMANLSAIVTARTVKLGESFSDGTMYVSDEAHHSLLKSAHFAGLPGAAVRIVPTDAHLRMDLGALRELISSDRAAGRRPFLVVGSAGTINIGAIDPLEDLAELARDEDMWFHVDGAYGGFFQLTARGRARLTGINLADSITLDPHKGMFLPYGTGCLLARDAAHLRAAHEVHADYLPPPSRGGLPDFSAFSPELTRDFRGLRVWLPLYLHGTDAWVQALDEKLDLAASAYEDLRSVAALEVPWPPALSLIAFRPKGADDAGTDALLQRINDTGRMWLSSARIRGRTFLRICILSHRSRPDRIREGIELLKTAADPG